MKSTTLAHMFFSEASQDRKGEARRWVRPRSGLAPSLVRLVASPPGEPTTLRSEDASQQAESHGVSAVNDSYGSVTSSPTSRSDGALSQPAVHRGRLPDDCTQGEHRTDGLVPRQ